MPKLRHNGNNSMMESIILNRKHKFKEYAKKYLKGNWEC